MVLQPAHVGSEDDDDANARRGAGVGLDRPDDARQLSADDVQRLVREALDNGALRRRAARARADSASDALRTDSESSTVPPPTVPRLRKRGGRGRGAQRSRSAPAFRAP